MSITQRTIFVTSDGTEFQDAASAKEYEQPMASNDDKEFIEWINKDCNLQLFLGELVAEGNNLGPYTPERVATSLQDIPSDVEEDKIAHESLAVDFRLIKCWAFSPEPDGWPGAPTFFADTRKEIEQHVCNYCDLPLSEIAVWDLLKQKQFGVHITKVALVPKTNASVATDR